ncbi:hypothetical protein WR25_21241 [Diploscapter pachys]|uniref:Uncharacterized protein n=1 Tax=Diploscapter pachys TaxID=2018661 RepID=A0A2A2JDB9_9BILA|nr:hypothetical protein WR25_21241 [Diploscapter pachys]
MDGHGLSRRVVDDIVSHHRNATVAQQPLANSPQQQINDMNTTQQAQVHEMLKLLSMQALSGQTANNGYNQLLLAMLQMQPNAAAQHIQAALLHAQAVQQHMLQQQLAAAIVSQQSVCQQQNLPTPIVSQVQAPAPAPAQPRPAQFQAGSISASPAVSELSELSPRSPANSINRPQSPPFKVEIIFIRILNIYFI